MCGPLVVTLSLLTDVAFVLTTGLTADELGMPLGLFNLVTTTLYVVWRANVALGTVRDVMLHRRTCETILPLYTTMEQAYVILGIWAGTLLIVAYQKPHVLQTDAWLALSGCTAVGTTIIVLPTILTYQWRCPRRRPNTSRPLGVILSDEFFDQSTIDAIIPEEDLQRPATPERLPSRA